MQPITIKHGYQLINTGKSVGIITESTGAIGMKVTENFLQLKIGDTNTNLDLARCSLEDLGKLVEIIDGLKRKIIGENSQNIESFKDIEQYQKNISPFLRSIIIFLGNIIASSNILLKKGILDLNPLATVKKAQEIENQRLSLTQGLFLALIRKIRTLAKNEENQERKKKYNDIILSSRSVIQRFGKLKDNQNAQIKSLS